MPFVDGPYIQMAGFCDNVIEDKGGVLSVIRVVDRVIHTVGDVAPPEEMPPFIWQSNLVVMLKSGRALGRHELKIVPQLPNGATQDPMLLTIFLEGEERGQNIILRFGTQFTIEGLYWFKIYFDNELLTSIPLRVMYNRITTGGPPTPPAQGPGEPPA